MKHTLSILFLFFVSLSAAGCHDDDTISSEPVTGQHLTCRIFLPEDGSAVSTDEKLIIRGEGTADNGKIISAELKVGGITISDISSVPFYYEYIFTNTLPGELKIELQVKGDADAVATTSVTVHTVAGK